MTAEEIAEAFNTASARGFWKAKHLNTKGKTFVLFDDDKSMVSFQYVLDTQEFQVKFRKVTGQFGDYANAIARGLTTILTALQAGGAPFKAPESAEGVEIVVKHNGAGNAVTCRVSGSGYYEPELSTDKGKDWELQQSPDDNDPYVFGELDGRKDDNDEII